MYLTKILINFLDLSCKLSNSTILLTDKEHIIFVSSNIDSKIYLDKKISRDLKNILKLYETDQSTINYMNTTMDSIVNLSCDDNTNMYSSQIILPISHEHVDGLLIFFTNNRKYLPSNLNFAMTTKQFTEIFSTKEYLV